MRDSEHALIEKQAETTEARLRALRERNAARERTLIQGEPAQRGDVGPMPMHEWSGSKLRLQQGPTGDSWGEWTDLEGPPGKDGETRVISGGGGGPIVINGFFPQGW